MCGNLVSRQEVSPRIGNRLSPDLPLYIFDMVNLSGGQMDGTFVKLVHLS